MGTIRQPDLADVEKGHEPRRDSLGRRAENIRLLRLHAFPAGGILRIY